MNANPEKVHPVAASVSEWIAAFPLAHARSYKKAPNIRVYSRPFAVKKARILSASSLVNTVH
jgi:hypothetical protein